MAEVTTAGAISPPFLFAPVELFPVRDIFSGMEIHPIRNDDDHAAALREIEHLWGAAAGTEESDKLDILATLVEKYEEQRWPESTSNLR